MVNLYGHLTMSMLASFIYRLYILHYSTPTRKQMLFVVFLVCIPTVAAFCVGTVSIYGLNAKLDCASPR